MKKVYLIMVGEYSDRHCVGFCTTEEEAIRYCAAKNGNMLDRTYGDRYEYEEQKCLDGKLHWHVNIGYSFKNVFECNGGDWVRAYTSDGTPMVEHTPRVIERNNPYRVFVLVWLKTDEQQKAIKIAQDELYKWIYERQEREKDFAERLKKYILK